MNTEAARLGLIKRKLMIPEATIFNTVVEMAELVNKMFIVCSKLFKMVLGFAQRYLNDSYSVSLVVNMARLKAAEIDLNEMLKTTTELVGMMNLIRLRNICSMVYIKVNWVKKARKKIMLLNQSKKHRLESQESSMALDQGSQRDSQLL